MKLFSLVLAVLFFASATPAQNNLQPLAENASIEETQKWLEKAIEKFSPNDVYSLKFKECSLRFGGAGLYVSDVISENVTAPTNTASGGGLIYPTSWRYSLDLKQLDANNIFLKATKSEDVEALILNSLAGKTAVGYKMIYPRSTSRNLLRGSYASFNLKKEVAEQIKAGFIRIIKQCQSEK